MSDNEPSPPPFPRQLKSMGAFAMSSGKLRLGVGEQTNEGLDYLWEAVRRWNAHEDLIEALKEISKGEGAFNRDSLTHAENCIKNMKEIAEAAIVAASSKEESK